MTNDQSKKLKAKMLHYLLFSLFEIVVWKWLTYAILPLEGGVEVGPEGGVDAELALRHRELGEHVGDGRRLLRLGLGLLREGNDRSSSNSASYHISYITLTAAIYWKEIY